MINQDSPCCFLFFPYKQTGPSPEVDMVLSILLQSPISTGLPGKTSSVSQMPGGPAPSTSDLSGSSKSRMNPNGSSQRIVREGLSGKRKELESIKLPFPFLPCMPHTHTILKSFFLTA